MAFPIAVVRKFGDDRGSSLAALISYYTFFSLFPLLVVLATVTGFFIRGHPDRQAALIHSALAQFPVVGANIEGNVHALNGNLLTLGLGIAGCLWAGAAVSDALRTAMDDIRDVPRHYRAPMWRGRLFGLAWLLVFMMGVVGSGSLLSIATVTRGGPPRRGTGPGDRGRCRRRCHCVPSPAERPPRVEGSPPGRDPGRPPVGGSTDGGLVDRHPPDPGRQ